MGGVSPGEAMWGTPDLAPFLAFRDSSTQTYFIAIADRAHPSVNFLGLPHPVLPPTQCGRVWPGRKRRPWAEERSHKLAAGGASGGHKAEDDGGVGDGDDAELEASECAACETGRIRF